jgi:hypothetical protein
VHQEPTVLDNKTKPKQPTTMMNDELYRNLFSENTQTHLKNIERNISASTPGDAAQGWNWIQSELFETVIGRLVIMYIVPQR